MSATGTESKPGSLLTVKRLLVPLLLLVWLAGFGVLCRPARALRIVSFTPSSTEMLFAIGAGPEVVAVTSADAFPPEVKRLPQIGGVEPNRERVLSLEPDLIVGEADLAGGRLERYEAFGVRTLALETHRLMDIPKSLEKLGAATGHLPEAREAARLFRRKLRELCVRTSSRRPRVYVELWDHPLMTSGPGSFLSDLIECAGGENIARDLPKGFQTISEERVVASNPEIIVLAHEKSPEEIRRRPGWRRVFAVARGHIHPVDPDLVMRPTPRAVAALSLLCRWIRRKP